MALKRILFFLIYFMAALAVFAVLRFPDQTVAVKVSRMAQALFPEHELTLNPISLAAPLGLKTKKPEIRLYDAITVIPDDLRFFIPVSAALRLKKDLFVESSVLNGTVTAHLTGVSTSPPACSGLAVIHGRTEYPESDSRHAGRNAVRPCPLTSPAGTRFQTGKKIMPGQRQSDSVPCDMRHSG
jgi:hypothetical protein